MRARHFGALLLSSLIGPCGSVALRVVPSSPSDGVAGQHEVLARAPRMLLPTTGVEPAPPATRSGDAGVTSLPADSSAHLPLTFIENAGQWDTPARFVARDGGRTVRVEPDALVLQLEEFNCHENPRGEVLRLAFEQANSAAVVVGEGRLPGDHNFIQGKEPSGWITGVGGYASVVYQALYAGVDVRLHEREGQLEYDLVLAPEADLAAVALRCDGADGLEVDRDGALVVQTPLGPIRQSPPVAWEESESGDRHPLACRYRLIDEETFGFEAPDRDPRLRAVIDPCLVWSTFLGGLGGERPNDIALLPSGDVVVVGSTDFSGFPTTPGVYDATWSGKADATVTRLTANGSALVFSTLIGGSADDTAWAVATAPNDDVIVGGFTWSPEFPTTPGSFSTTLSGALDAYALRLTSDGSALVWSTFLGGSGVGADRIFAIVVAPDESVVTVGQTTAILDDFPTTPGAFSSHFSGQIDAFVSRISADGSSLLASTLVGGSDQEAATCCAVAPDGDVILGGFTKSPDFPTTSGVLYPTFLVPPLVGMGFVCRVSADATSLRFSTYYPGSAHGLVLGPGDRVTFAGNISATDASFFTATPGAYDATFTGTFSNAHVSTIDSTGALLLAATYVGGGTETVFRMAADDAGFVVAGTTSSAGYPTTPDAFDSSYSGSCSNGFVFRVDPTLSTLVYSTFLGVFSSWCTAVYGVAVDNTGAAVLAGNTTSPGFPVTPGAFDTTQNGQVDAFIMRLATAPPWTSVGAGTAGTMGVPSLTGSGSTCPGANITVTLSNALPASSVVLVLGFLPLNAPLKGGLLVPYPNLLIPGLITSSQGGLTLSAAWPANIPSAFSFWLQAWMPDPAGPVGFAASNGLRLTVP